MASRAASVGSVFFRIAPSSRNFIRDVGRDANAAAGDVQAALNDATSTGVSQGLTQGAQDAGSTVAAGVGDPTQQAVATGTTGGVRAGMRKAVGMMGGLVAAWGLKTLISNEVTKAFEFETKTATITARLDLSDDERATVEEASRNLFAQAYGESKGEVADAMASIIGSVESMRGATSKELEAATKDVLNLSTAFEEVDPETLALAGQTFTNAGLGNFDDFMEVAAYTLTHAGASGHDALDTLNEYSGDIRSAGLTGEEAAMLMVDFIGVGGMNTDKIADGLFREMSIKAREMPQDLMDSLVGVGVDPQEFRAAALKGGDEWRQMWGRVATEFQKTGDSNAMVSLFGTQSEDMYHAFTQMDFSPMSNAAAEVDGAMEKMDETLTGTRATAWEKNTRAIGLALSSGLVPILEKLEPILSNFATWATENEELMSVGLVVALGAATLALAAFTAGLIASGVAALANPIVWIVIAAVAGVALLVAAVVLLVKNWDLFTAGIAAAGKAVGAWIAGAAVAVFDFLTGVGEKIGGVFEAIGFGIGWVIEKMGGFFSGVATWIGEAVGHVLDFILGIGVGIGEGIANAFAAIGDGIRGVIEYAVGLVTGAVDTIVNSAKGFRDAVVNVFKGIGNYMIGAANLAISGINGIIRGLNSIRINVPSWVPHIGGASWGMSLPYVPSIPALATGADILGPTIALLGEKDPETVVNRGGVNRLIDQTNNRLDHALAAPVTNVTVENHLDLTMRETENLEEFVERIAEELAKLSRWKQ